MKPEGAAIDLKFGFLKPYDLRRSHGTKDILRLAEVDFKFLKNLKLEEQEHYLPILVKPIYSYLRLTK